MSSNPIEQSFKSAAETHIKDKSQQVGTLSAVEDPVAANQQQAADQGSESRTSLFCSYNLQIFEAAITPSQSDYLWLSAFDMNNTATFEDLWNSSHLTTPAMQLLSITMLEA